MSPGQLVPAFALLLLVGCSDGNGTGITNPDSNPPGPAASIELKASAAVLEVGGTVQLTATAKDASGKTVPDVAFTWSSGATLLATISNAGLVSGRSPGTAVFTAILASGLSKSGTLAVTAPPRPEGSFLVIGRDSVFQHGDFLPLATIGMADISAAGTDRRMGIAHTELPNSAMNPSVSRGAFPLLSALAECPNGEVYAASYSTSQDGIYFFQVDPQTATLTMFIREHGIRGVIRSMFCDSANDLWFAGEFASVGDLFRVHTPSKQVYLVRRYNTVSTAVSVRGMAQAPTGAIFATVVPSFTSDGQLVVTINPTSGAWTSVTLGQPTRFPIVSDLAFRSSTLFGRAGNSLVEINPQTGAVSRVRSLAIP